MSRIIVSINGPKGSGKTALANQLERLHGISYEKGLTGLKPKMVRPEQIFLAIAGLAMTRFGHDVSQIVAMQDEEFLALTAHMNINEEGKILGKDGEVPISWFTQPTPKMIATKLRQRPRIQKDVEGLVYTFCDDRKVQDVVYLDGTFVAAPSIELFLTAKPEVLAERCKDTEFPQDLNALPPRRTNAAIIIPTDGLNQVDVCATALEILASNGLGFLTA